MWSWKGDLNGSSECRLMMNNTPYIRTIMNWFYTPNRLGFINQQSTWFHDIGSLSFSWSFLWTSLDRTGRRFPVLSGVWWTRYVDQLLSNAIHSFFQTLFVKQGVRQAPWTNLSRTLAMLSFAQLMNPHLFSFFILCSDADSKECTRDLPRSDVSRCITHENRFDIIFVIRIYHHRKFVGTPRVGPSRS